MILILHVAAIGAILLHNQSTKGDLVAAVPGQTEVAKADSPKASILKSEEPLPQIGPDEKYVWVESGDTYGRIARKYGVDEALLRRMNDNLPLRGGLNLRLPSASTSAPAVQMAYEDTDSLLELTPIETPLPPEEVPMEYEVVQQPEPIEMPEALPLPEPEPLETRAVRAEIVPVAEPVVEEELVEVTESKPKPVVVEEAKPEPKPTPQPRKTYVLRKGDTAWSIARRHGVSPQKLLSVNGIKDARKMKIGMKLIIPTN
ncbi:MAG: LysM peptidoglycan-binding domain-containing protein [Verrucomicrobiota bacterium]